MFLGTDSLGLFWTHFQGRGIQTGYAIRAGAVSVVSLSVSSGLPTKWRSDRNEPIDTNQGTWVQLTQPGDIGSKCFRRVVLKVSRQLPGVVVSACTTWTFFPLLACVLVVLISPIHNDRHQYEPGPVWEPM